MLERLVERDVAEVGDRRITEGAARGREHEARDVALGLVAQELMDRVVLAVDRQQARAGDAGGFRDELAGEHEEFLARERDVLLRLEGRERRREAGGADDGRDDHRDFRQAGDFGQAGGAFQEAGAGGESSRSAGFGRSGRIGEGHDADAEFLGRADEFAPARMGGQSGDAQAGRVGPDDAQGGRADGAGGSEDGDGPDVHAAWVHRGNRRRGMRQAVWGG